MDALGSVSSVLKSLDMIAKGAVFLQGIPEIQSDYEELRKQVAFMKDMVRDAQEFAGDSLSGMQQITTAATYLKEICDALETIGQGCIGSSGDTIIKHRKIEKLLQRAKDARSDLWYALLLQRLQQPNQDQAFLLRQLEKQSTMEAQMSQIHEFVIAFGKTMNVCSNVPSSEISSHDLPATKPSAERSTPGTTNEVQKNYMNGDEVEEIPANEVIRCDEVARSQKPIPPGRPRCLTNCKCRCHAKPWVFEYPRWIKPVFGSLTVTYYSGYEQAGLKWDYRCVCRKEGYLSLNYKLPKWPFMGGNSCSEPRYSLRCSLRPVRTFNPGTGLLLRFNLPAREFENLLIDEGFFFPQDELLGFKLIELILFKQNYDLLEFLLEIWASVLAQEGLPRQIYYAINCCRLKDPTERHNWLLGRIESYIDDKPEWESLLLEEAVSENDVKEALAQEPWSINVPDHQGSPRIHRTIHSGQADVLQHFINAGADINCRDVLGRTPLMAAATFGQIECVRRILEAKCRINERAGAGQTALYLAVVRGQHEAVRLLVEKVASVCICDVRGRTPLHILGEIKQSTVTEEILHLLLGQKSSPVEVRDMFGRTPMMCALQKNNEPVLRRLVGCGASLNSIDDACQNILHYIARYCNLECLVFFDELQLTGIDTELLTTNGYTPWDVFILYLYGPEGDSDNRVSYSLGEIMAFVQLYQDIRDRNLRYETSLLGQSLEALSKNKSTAACKHLSVLAQWKTDCGSHNVAGWYRAVTQLIKAGTWDMATVQIQEYEEELAADIGTSPWRKSNKMGWEYMDEHINSWIGGNPIEAMEEHTSQLETTSESDWETETSSEE